MRFYHTGAFSVACHFSVCINHLPQGPQLKIWGRAGLMGYIILFALWQIVQPCGNRYIQAGNLKERIRFPLIWRGFREYIWRFVLVFCVLCAAVTVFTYLQTNRTQLILYGLLFAVINSFLEEVLWRGFILARTVDSLGKKQALIVTSLAFGFYHLSLDFSILSCLAFSVGGFYMGGTAIQSKGIFASISMHLAVNMFFVSLGLIF